MSRIFKIGTLLIAASMVFTLSGCSRTVSQVDSRGQTAKPVFPLMTKASRPEGSYVNIDQLLKVKAGLTKSQLYELIGAPHFSEGSFGVREWDYIFKFQRLGQSDLVCQFKVLFDDNIVARSFYFQPENCLAQLKDKPQQKASAVSVVRAEPRTFSAEALFGFNSAALTPEGRHNLSLFAAEIKASGIDGHRLQITGHTDRLGRPDYNQRLSLARAESVREVLVVEGINRQQILVRGVGAAEPVVNCAGKKSTTLITCLAPNRRIVIELM